jgi:hypothetical protein
MTDDPQEHAEALDEDVIDAVDDRTGDQYGEGLPDYPPPARWASTRLA